MTVSFKSCPGEGPCGRTEFEMKLVCETNCRSKWTPLIRGYYETGINADGKPSFNVLTKINYGPWPDTNKTTTFVY